jgi:hypothetical protein
MKYGADLVKENKKLARNTIILVPLYSLCFSFFGCYVQELIDRNKIKNASIPYSVRTNFSENGKIITKDTVLWIVPDSVIEEKGIAGKIQQLPRNIFK